ncbi:cystathionine gamma-lyase-like [Lycorma delicatula]|uniref:cystathionine gamma-lyase-like n=1 Tax=Lycorma delicatula TaxID=130591 RepID=UPI003F513732
MDITQRKHVKIIALEVHTSMMVRDISSAVSVCKSSEPRILTTFKKSGSLLPKRKGKCGQNGKLFQELKILIRNSKINPRKISSDLKTDLLATGFDRPLELGADIAMYSATKYLNGHADVIMGALTLNDDELFNRLKYNQNSTGIIPSPIDCFLVNRSIKTLHLRMDEHMRNGLAVAKYLEAHQDIEKVLHPGLPSHPHHKLALRQWSGYSSMVSFYHKYGLNESKKFLQSLNIFSLAESLGCHKSLAEIPILMTHASVPANERSELGIMENLIRLSIGLESIPDLLEDLGQALKAMKI